MGLKPDQERWNTEDPGCVIRGDRQSMGAEMNDNVVKQTRMRYLWLALHNPGNLRLSLGAFAPCGLPSPRALPANRRSCIER